jgi:rhodanese-related sulfurtransferase
MPTASNQKYRTVTPDEVAAMLENGDEIFIVDVRDMRPFRAGHIPDAIHLPADDFADRFSRELSPDDTVILVCEKGATSGAAAEYLIAQGFTDVATMSGGMLAWTGPLVRKE